ncbi:MAG: ISL3 family transposase, partial [Actinobacteria bacterium]|nr:ISL3 family transposase [Actinomycetota bacterium]
LEADAPRVYCKVHRVVVAQVPWARHDSRFTIAFEDQCCWLAVNTSKKAVAELMRVTWRTVGAICERVADAQIAQRDLFAGLKRVGIDDFSHRKGHRYLTVVVDHDSGRLVWAAPGRDRKTVEKFLDLLGEERCAQIELVSCDMAEAIAGAVAERCPNAVRCVDPFHVIALATDALDEIRREVWNQARRDGHKQAAKQLKGARFVLWKNAHRLTERQHQKLAQIQQTNKPLYRAYLISQQLREIYRVTYEEAVELLDAWLAWARRCRLAPFVKLAKTITKQRPGIEAAIRHRLSNARIEQVNTQLRLITRRAYGFRTPEALIAPRHAQPRRPLPTTTRMTPGNSRRSRIRVGRHVTFVKPGFAMAMAREVALAKRRLGSVTALHGVLDEPRLVAVRRESSAATTVDFALDCRDGTFRGIETFLGALAVRADVFTTDRGPGRLRRSVERDIGCGRRGFISPLAGGALASTPRAPCRAH